MKRKNIVLIVVFATLFLVFGVPIIINECYKTGGYVTLWTPADVLSYYGTILGSVVSVLVLATTILFTRKQIIHDQNVKNQTEQWKKVEVIIIQAIKAVDPLEPARIVQSDTGFQQVSDTITKLQFHIIKAKTSLDMLMCYIDSKELMRISELSQSILECVKGVETHTAQYVKELSRLRENEIWKNHEEIVRIATQYSYVNDKETQKSRDYMLNNPYHSPDIIMQNIGEINIALTTLHNTAYQELLNLKRETFKAIDKENTAKSNKLLSWF